MGVRDRMKALAHKRCRFGYRCLHILLRRKGYVVNHKRLFRIYQEERLMVRKGRTQAGHGNTGADDDPVRSERSLVARPGGNVTKSSHFREQRKSAAKYLTQQRFFMVAGTGFEPVTFRL
jgi:hypothetical protein